MFTVENEGSATAGYPSLLSCSRAGYFFSFPTLSNNISTGGITYRHMPNVMYGICKPPFVAIWAQLLAFSSNYKERLRSISTVKERRKPAAANSESRRKQPLVPSIGEEAVTQSPVSFER